MLPVTDVVAKVEERQRKDVGSGIEGVEVKVENVNAAIILVVDNDGGIFARSKAIAVWGGTAKPCWGGSWVVVGGQVDVYAKLIDV